MFCDTVDSQMIEQLPIALFHGEIIEVKTPLEASEALYHLEGETLLGFDTETRPTFSPQHGKHHKTSLMQLATQERVFLFRLPYCGVTNRMVTLLSNPCVLKVGVAVRDDIRGLLAYRSFIPAGFVDLQEMAEPLGIKEKSLRKLAAIILNLRVTKGQQLSNWDNRIFTQAQRKYAALDAYISREIYLKLSEDSGK